MNRLGWRDSSIAVLGLAVLLIACFIKINYFYADPQNQYQYYAGSVLFYSSTLVLETGAISIIAKTIPPVLSLGYWNAGLLGGCGELLGRTFGGVSFTIYSMFDSVMKNRAEPFFAYVVNAVVTGILLSVTILIYPRLSKHMEIEMLGDDV